MPTRPETSRNIQLAALWASQGRWPGKRIYDASFYVGQPDLRPRGFQPFYLCYDSDLNRFDPAYDNPNTFPNFADPVVAARIQSAYRYSARAAAGLVNLAHHNISQATAYRDLKHAVLAYNWEGYGFGDADAQPAVNRSTRQALLAKLATLLGWVRDQWSIDGVTGVDLGVYFWPPAFNSENPNAADYEANLTLARQDFEAAGLIDLVDAFYPEGPYLYTTDVDSWITNGLGRRLNQCAAQDADKPVYVFMAPHYAPSTAGGLAGQPIPEDKWLRVMDAIMQRADGVVLWGGHDETPGGDGETHLDWIDAGFDYVIEEPDPEPDPEPDDPDPDPQPDPGGDPDPTDPGEAMASADSSSTNDLAAAIAQAAAEPTSYSRDGESMSQRSLSELIEADKYLASKRAAKKKGAGLRFFKMIPPGGD